AAATKSLSESTRTLRIALRSPLTPPSVVLAGSGGSFSVKCLGAGGPSQSAEPQPGLAERPHMSSPFFHFHYAAPCLISMTCAVASLKSNKRFERRWLGFSKNRLSIVDLTTAKTRVGSSEELA